MLQPKIALIAAWAATLSALTLTAACTGDDEAPDPPDGGYTVTTMRGALLQAQEIGPTWQPPTASTDPSRLVALCAGQATAPPVPPGAEVVSSPLADEGEQGAQSLSQTAMVYPNESSAQAGLAALKAVADACPANVSQPAVTSADRNEPGYTETAQSTAMNEGGWTGFVITRHKAYEAAHPGTADTAIAVVTRANVLFVDAYAVFRLGKPEAAPSAASQFDGDWKKLVGTVLNRVG